MNIMRHLISLIETITSSVDLSSASKDQLKQIASEYDDPEGGTWEFVPNFPIHEYIHDARDRAEWFQRTLRNETDPESREHLTSLMKASTFEPIILWITATGDVYIWDGNHRLGAACLRDEDTIPAIVGTADA
jgi:hypothetical protein